MTDNNHPITPPPELVSDWRLAPEYTDGLGKLTMVTITVDRLQYIATQAARWGADQELEACCEWLVANDWMAVHRNLHAARRTKPPSLKEQALEALKREEADSCSHHNLAIIRRALESLSD